MSQHLSPVVSVSRQKLYPETPARAETEVDDARYATSKQPRQLSDQVLTGAGARRVRNLSEVRTADQPAPRTPNA